MNQELKQYFQFLVDHKQKYQPEQPVISEFVINNKIYYQGQFTLAKVIQKYNMKDRNRRVDLAMQGNRRDKKWCYMNN